MKSAAVGCAVLITVVLLIGETATWVVNVPGSPMFLEGHLRGGYTLKNTGGKGIVSFTLGCVEVKKHRIIVISTLPPKKFSIQPGGSISEAIVDSPYTPPYEQCVVKQKAKLALISAEFVDDSAWSVSRK